MKFLGFNPIALRKAKIVCNFGLSECSRVREQDILKEHAWKYFIVEP